MANTVASSIRKELLNAFSKSEGSFISGQALADILGCSRTAVWKHIDELRKAGFEVEAVRKKGYRLLEKPDKLSENEVRIGLETKVLGQHIIHFESIDSTQKVAQQAAYDSCPEGTVILAEEQTKGRGRMARPWHSKKSDGIWMSIVLKPKLPPQKAPQFTLIAAVAVVQAIEETAGLSPEIKWPNDILLNGKKITGILTELQAESDTINALIIGIGVNVNQEDFPEELAGIATSLAIEKGEHISRVKLVQSILRYLEKYYGIYMEQGFGPLKLLWESYALSIGKRIIARTLSGEVAGTALGITSDGILRVMDDLGTVHDIYSADIELK